MPPVEPNRAWKGLRCRLSGQTAHEGAPATGPSCQATGRKSSRTRQNVVPGYRMVAGHYYVVISSLDDDDSQEAGAMHAVDADQLDVGGCRAAGDPGHRTGRVLAEDVHRLGDRGYDVGGLEDDDVGVGHERDRAATVSAILRT